MDADAILFHQDVTETVDVDVIPDLYLEETITVVYGSSFFSSSVADVAAAHGETMDATTTVSGLSFFSSSVVETHGTITDVDATTVDAANKKKF